MDNVPAEADPDSVWHARFDSLIRLCDSIDWSCGLDAVYQEIARALVVAFRTDAAYIHLYSITGQYLVGYDYYDDFDSEIAGSYSRLDLSFGRIRRVLETKRPIVVDFVHPRSDDSISDVAMRHGFVCAVTAPLLAGEEVLGTYSLSFKTKKTWTESDMDYYCLIGQLIGMTIRYAMFQTKATELQILDERTRLSTEIHDNLSQTISTIKLGIDAALISYEQGDYLTLRKRLDRLNDLGKEAMTSLRFEMLSLRDAPNRSDDLVLSIRDCLARFEIFWGIECSLQLNNLSDSIMIPSHIWIQFSRILHEALSNVIRHSSATKVCVMLEEFEGRLRMKVVDNGCGFDSTSVSPARLGIRIMQERADMINGHLAVSSEEHGGTTVCIEAPYSL